MIRLITHPVPDPPERMVPERPDRLLDVPAPVACVAPLGLEGMARRAELIKHPVGMLELGQKPQSQRGYEGLAFRIDTRALEMPSDPDGRFLPVLPHPRLNRLQTDRLKEPAKHTDPEEHPPLRIQ